MRTVQTDVKKERVQEARMPTQARREPVRYKNMRVEVKLILSSDKLCTVHREY